MSLQLMTPVSHAMNAPSMATASHSLAGPPPRREPQSLGHGDRIIGQSLAIRRVLEQVRKVAATDSTVLLLGETGSGKELFATEVHSLSPRRAHPMVRVNCAAIPATLLESELFGR